MFFIIKLYVIFYVSFYVINCSQDMENEKRYTKLMAGQIDPDLVNYARDQTELNWPLGIVPFRIDKSSYDDLISRRIRLAMNTIESVSCIYFKDITNSIANNYSTSLYFTNRDKVRECVHETSLFANGMIRVVVGIDCMDRRDILHTLLHALGFKDEVTHPQRDLYVRIFWENIQPKYRSLFNIQLEGTSLKTIVEYDPMSNMHFHDRAFSSNGGATIGPLVPGLIINPSDSLSQLDQMKLRLSFGHECNKRKIGDLLDTCKMVIHDDADEKKLAGKATDNDELQVDRSGNLNDVSGDVSGGTGDVEELNSDGNDGDNESR